MNLLISIRSEILKTKRTAALYFTLAGAAIIPAIFLLNAITDGLPDEDKSVKDPLNAIFGLSSEMIGVAIFPLFVVLICTLLPQIEYRNNTWKQVLTSPQTRINVFLARFLNIQLLMLFFLVANHLFLWLVIIAIHFILPDLNLLHRPLDMQAVFTNMAHFYLTTLAISALQFWIGLRFKNFIVPVAIGLTLWLTGTVLVLEYQSKLSPYFPYSFPALNFSSFFRPQLNTIIWTSMGYTLILLVTGFMDFKRRRMNG